MREQEKRRVRQGLACAASTCRGPPAVRPLQGRGTHSPGRPKAPQHAPQPDMEKPEPTLAHLPHPRLKGKGLKQNRAGGRESAAASGYGNTLDTQAAIHLEAYLKEGTCRREGRQWRAWACWGRRNPGQEAAAGRGGGGGAGGGAGRGGGGGRGVCILRTGSDSLCQCLILMTSTRPDAGFPMSGFPGAGPTGAGTPGTGSAGAGW